MLRLSLIALVSSVTLVACTEPQMSYREAKVFCQDKADAAAGPQGSAEFSVGTEGTNANFTISLSDSFLRGDDPEEVYDECMREMTGFGGY